MKIKFFIKKYRKNINSGFVSLFAVLISFIILAITLGLSNVAFKENILASSSKDGSYAFFAADSGLECALYHDSVGAFNDLSNLGSIDCAGQSHNLVADVNGIVRIKFEVDMGPDSLSNKARCVEIAINKNATINDSLGNPVLATQIYSNGYSSDCATISDILNLPNQRIVNRLLRATYPNQIVTP